MSDWDFFQAVEEGRSGETTSTVSGSATAEANFLVAKGAGEVGAEIASARGTEATGSRTLSSRVVALNWLRDARIPVVVDDFHYLPGELQGTIVRALKPLVFDGIPIVLIAIPPLRYDSIKVGKEMTGRMRPIEIPSWSEPELSFIPETGFELLEEKKLHITDPFFAFYLRWGQLSEA